MTITSDQIKSLFVGVALMSILLTAPTHLMALQNGYKIPLSVAPSAVQVINWHFSQNGLYVSAGCSATKIGQRTFLTAAHCIPILSSGVEITIYQTSNSEKFGQMAKVRSSESYFAYRQLNSTDISNAGADIGIFEIDRQTSNIAIADLPGAEQQLNKVPVFFAGYGNDGTSHSLQQEAVRGTVAIAHEFNARTLLLSYDQEVGEAGQGFSRQGDSGCGVMTLGYDRSLHIYTAGKTLLAVHSSGIFGEPFTFLRKISVYWGIETRIDIPEKINWIKKRIDVTNFDE
jgi:hypothetical protein